MICKGIFGEAFRWNSPEEIALYYQPLDCHWSKCVLLGVRFGRGGVRLCSYQSTKNKYSEDIKLLLSGLDSYISGTVEV